MRQGFRRMATIVRKEWLHIIRDQRTLALVIVFPVIMLVLLGYAVANDVEDIPLAVADLSKTDASRLLVDKFTVSGFSWLRIQLKVKIKYWNAGCRNNQSRFVYP